MKGGSFLPLFPLPRVVFPAEPVSLHIFEERYKLLIARCLERQEPFGIIQQQEGKLAQIGCAVRIDRVLTTYEDGRMDILVVGVQRFSVKEIFDRGTYLTATVDLLPDTHEEPDRAALHRAITQHMRLLELAGRTIRPTLYEGTGGVSYIIAMNAALDLDQKQQLLQIDSENERLQFLARHLEQIIPYIQEQETVKQKIRTNGYLQERPPSVE